MIRVWPHHFDFSFFPSPLLTYFLPLLFFHPSYLSTISMPFLLHFCFPFHSRPLFHSLSSSSMSLSSSLVPSFLSYFHIVAHSITEYVNSRCSPLIAVPHSSASPMSTSLFVLYWQASPRYVCYWPQISISNFIEKSPIRLAISIRIAVKTVNSFNAPPSGSLSSRTNYA